MTRSPEQGDTTAAPRHQHFAFGWHYRHMSQVPAGEPHAAEPQPPIAQSLMYQALSLEYGTLRDEIVAVMTARYQTLTVLSAAAAAVVSFAPAKSGLPKPLVYAVGI